MEKINSYWDLNRALVKLAKGCTSVKENTAARKMKHFLDNYSGLSWESYTSYREERDFYQEAFNTIKSGLIHSDSYDLRILEVESIDYQKDRIIIRTKSGGEVPYNNDFKRLFQLIFNG